MSIAAAKPRESDEYVRRYSVPNKRGGDVLFVCTDGNLYFPWYPLSKLKSTYIKERLDKSQIDVPGTVRGLSVLLAWIDSGETFNSYCEESFHVAAMFGLARYCTRVFHSLMETPQRLDKVQRYIGIITKYNVCDVRHVTIHCLKSIPWHHGHEMANIASLALRTLETLVPADMTQHPIPAIQEWIDYRRGTSVLKRPTIKQAENSSEERADKGV